MAVRGFYSKNYIFDKLKETFEGADFVSPKEFRIPINEDGETVEIKVTLTAAKDNMLNIAATPSKSTVQIVDGGFSFGASFDTETLKEDISEPTEEEINNVKTLMNSLDSMLGL